MSAPLSVALLANPESGSGDAELVAETMRREGARVEVFDCDEGARAAATGADRLVVAGGDGSLSAAAAAASDAGLDLAVVAVGTANDFAREMDLSQDIEEACRLAVHGAQTRSLELGWMGDRPFLNVVSAGLSPAAAREAEGMKNVFGAFAYALGAVRAGFKAQVLRCAIRCDGDVVFDGDAWQVSVASSGGFGGGASFDADPADGMLDVIVIPADSRVRLIRRAAGMRRGTLGDQESVESFRCKEADVDVPDETAFNVDGEVMRSGSAHFTVQPAAFALVVG